MLNQQLNTMSKTKTILTLIMGVVLSSCDKNIENIEPKPDGDEIGLFTFGDGKYDAVGQGTDVTIDYANIESTRYAVIDVERLAADYPQEVVISYIYDEKHNGIYSAEAYSYSEEMSKQQSSTAGFAIFKRNISSSFSNTTTSSEKFDGKYIYAFYDFYKRIKQVSIPTEKLYILRNYLTNTFWDGVNNLTPEQLVRQFGTHVMTNIYVGGKLNLRYRAESRSSDRKTASEHGMNWGVSRISGMNNTSGATSEQKQNFNQSMLIEAHGGSVSISGTKGSVTEPPTLNINDWKNSITEQTSQLIDFGSKDSLVPIYEFITDPAKKAAVKEYVENYIRASQVVTDYYFAGWYGNNEEYGWNANKSGQFQEKEYNAKSGTGNSTFRAPKAGVYKINASFYGYKEGGSGSGSGNMQLRVYNSAGGHVGTFVNQNFGAGSGWTRAGLNGNIKLSAGDQIRVRISGGDVGAIDRWVRYRMENMDIVYVSQ